MGGFWCLNMTNWVRYPLPLFWAFSPWRACEVEMRYPPPLKRGISAILVEYLMTTRQMDAIPPLCDAISKGYCAIWGGISHWAAKPVVNQASLHQDTNLCCNDRPAQTEFTEPLEEKKENSLPDIWSIASSASVCVYSCSRHCTKKSLPNWRGHILHDQYLIHNFVIFGSRVIVSISMVLHADVSCKVKSWLTYSTNLRTSLFKICSHSAEASSKDSWKYMLSIQNLTCNDHWIWRSTTADSTTAGQTTVPRRGAPDAEWGLSGSISGVLKVW